ncbi:4Fe-4S dicluster domain-containing protein [Ornithinimicrobium avium]|uniref:4Fe-4S dicluster domain-containing protein n=1 Tax=Ornithinimicrobium avium TaxID=2283195 RepID=A0A345NNE0_9MICO|nr:4Fe-4S dicluster domain-containing protein [Ornithinimicrobium avium]AXH96548.1 4Fe-4S dicluster domain-containing protein [Ornithinimicrobium avium]
MGYLARQLAGPTDPARDAGWSAPEERKGFFTDTSICIGCKACEVACKEWNALPLDGLDLSGDSYDNTGGLGASTWRHVAFVEQSQDRIEEARASGRRLVDLGMPQVGAPAPAPSALRTGDTVGAVPPTLPDEGDGGLDIRNLLGGAPTPDFRWLMSSDVCKHCTHAGCLDVCPTGALFRSEHGTVVVQADICNGCGYCVGACPFGVIERRTDAAVSVRKDGHVPDVGVAQKCTLCYDRLSVGQEPACAQTCPTTSIRFGTREEMVSLAHDRVVQLHDQGFTEARLYGANDEDGVGGTGSVFLLLDEPEVYGLPPDPVVPTAKLPEMFRQAGYAGLGLLGAAALAFVGRRR